jgi:CheY-like chemotaxis protein
MIISDILRGAGFDNILFARDGAELLRMTIEQNPRIVITNSRLPQLKISGLEFTRLVRAGHGGINRALSIIVTTSNATVSFIDAARASGVDEMLVRPFTAAALLARVEAVLVRPRRFIDSVNYIGPCRRRRMLEEYDGPMRRICDPFEDMENPTWEIEANRALAHQAVKKIAECAAHVVPGDRRRINEFYRAVQDGAQLAEEIDDEMLARATKSMALYINAVGASPDLDREVVRAHVDAMGRLGGMTSAQHPQREAVVDGLEAIVNKRLGRAPADYADLRDARGAA